MRCGLPAFLLFARLAIPVAIRIAIPVAMAGWLTGAIAQTSSPASGVAAPGLERLDLLPRQDGTSPSITPIFSQIVLFSLPDDFKLAPATVRKGRFVQQAVPRDESVGRWTQTIVVSGDEALAFSGRTWPQQMVDAFTARLKAACPETFDTVTVPKVYVGSYDTAVAVAGCGGSGARPAETTLKIVVKGGMDIYSIEWTVRSAGARGPLKIDLAPWTERLRRLAPIKICRVPQAEELPPYATCLRSH